MIAGDELLAQARAGQLVLLDIRTPKAYTAGHVPTSMSAPYSRPGWGRAVRRWLDTQGTPAVALLADNQVVADAAQAELAAEGVRVADVLAGGPAAWQTAGLALVAVAEITADQLARSLDEWMVIDVREPYEWRSGIIPGALTIPLNQLPKHVDGLDRSRRYALACASGNRSQTAAAYLADQGFQVGNLTGGMALWLGGRHPVDYPAPRR
jgi:rhodanese-related sulfurtransferase